jgi:hypothetical protein
MDAAFSSLADGRSYAATVSRGEPKGTSASRTPGRVQRQPAPLNRRSRGPPITSLAQARPLGSFLKFAQTYPQEAESGKTIASTAESNAERMAAALEPRHGPLTIVPA